MGSSILSEVDDTSIVRTGLSTCYWRSLGRLPAYRLLTPRSGLERSRFWGGGGGGGRERGGGGGDGRWRGDVGRGRGG